MSAPAVGHYTQLAAGKGVARRLYMAILRSPQSPFIVRHNQDDPGLILSMYVRFADFQVGERCLRLTSSVSRNKQKQLAVPEVTDEATRQRSGS
jgi:hypothetical protein